MCFGFIPVLKGGTFMVAIGEMSETKRAMGLVVRSRNVGSSEVHRL